MADPALNAVIEEVVARVLAGLKNPDAPAAATPAAVGGARAAESVIRGDGVFETVDEAASAAEAAFHAWKRLSLEFRARVIAVLRKTALDHKEMFSREELAETGLGRLDHKILKMELIADRTPGVEFLTTWCKTGDHGLSIEEPAPYGVFGVVTPSTHVVPTLLNNAISLLSAGNTAVFGAHPSGKRVFAKALAIFNRAMTGIGAPPNLLTTIRDPTIESADQMFRHPKVRLLLVTGGPGVVKAALNVPKRAITAGPGNPPVVVDETADIGRAARDIIVGAGFDNNIICIGEKEVFAVDKIADALKKELVNRGCVELKADQAKALAEIAFQRKPGEAHAVVNRALVGKNASVLAKAIGLTVPDSTPLLICETDRNDPWVVEEQMMPCIPIVRTRDTLEAIDWAIVAEHGFRHTAIMHSKNIENMSIMAQRCDCSIFVKNGPSLAGLGAGGEGHTSFSIASPTGEGITTCRTFSRLRRCTLVDYFRIV